MFLITCPYCGERDQSEFRNGGEAHIDRPVWRDDMTDAEWADFVFLRSNEKGVISERWNHAAGCGKWFNMMRNSATDKILGVYEMGQRPPANEDDLLPTPSGELPGSGNDAVQVVIESDTGEQK